MGGVPSGNFPELDHQIYGNNDDDENEDDEEQFHCAVIFGSKALTM